MSTARQHWGGLDHERHLLLIDSALDDIDTRIAAGFASLEAKQLAGFAECEARDRSTRTLLVSLLVSVVVACVIIVATVLTAGAG